VISAEGALFLAALAGVPLPWRFAPGGARLWLDRGLIAADAIAAGVAASLAHEWACAAERGAVSALETGDA